MTTRVRICMHFIVAGNSSNTYACCSMRCLWCITWSLDCWYFSLQANYMWTIILSSLFAYLICVQEFLCFHMTIMLVWTVNVICLELGQVRNLALMQFVLIMCCLMKFGPKCIYYYYLFREYLSSAIFLPSMLLFSAYCYDFGSYVNDL